MSSEEIDSILRIQYMATHPPDSSPYTQDYYASAAAVKAAGDKAMAAAACKFFPQQLREVLPQERTGAPPPPSPRRDGVRVVSRTWTWSGKCRGLTVVQCHFRALRSTA
eukprot:794659-Prorocentrum_minimum.AAC.1